MVEGKKRAGGQAGRQAGSTRDAAVDARAHNPRLERERPPNVLAGGLFAAEHSQLQPSTLAPDKALRGFVTHPDGEILATKLSILNLLFKTNRTCS